MLSLQLVCYLDVLLNNVITMKSGACAGFLKGVGEELARSAGSEIAASEAICGNEFYAKQIGYQYRRFKAVDNTL